MPLYFTPGVYFQSPEPRTVPFPQRTDVAGFVGLAERGPLHQPQRVTTWREFRERFGDFLPYAHLAYAVHAFFENGGQACWVVRVADERSTHSSQLSIPAEPASPEPAYWVEAIYPGTWGNRLAVRVQAARLAASQHVVLSGVTLPPPRLAVSSIAGFEVGSMVRLTQALGTMPVQATAQVIGIDSVRGILQLNLSLPAQGLDQNTPNLPPISIESREFTLLVLQDDQVVERFDQLAIAPAHSRYAPLRVNANSRFIRLRSGSATAPVMPQLPWQGSLQGGGNGLRRLTVFDYVGTPEGDRYGLAALAEIDEVSILAIPDLTIRPQPPEKSQAAPRRKVNPCALNLPPLRSLKGKVRDALSGQPLPGVAIEVNDGLKVLQVETDAEGSFTLADLLPGKVELLISLEGYEPRIYPVTVLATTRGIQDLGRIDLTAVDLPPVLADDDIFYAQSALIRQCETLGDRFALLDPPLQANGTQPDLSRIQSWRSRFDSAYAALYYPWVVVGDLRQSNAPRLVPPCGHVAGIYAATDLSEGAFRPPANKALADVEDVGVGIDDALQGVLNPLGINAIRAFPGRGIRVFGARTLSRDTAWRFVNVRRLISLLEEMMEDGLQWAVFEPNSEALRFEVRLYLSTLLDGFWRRGAFVGETADAAYQVRCDAVTNPADLQAEGQLIAEVKIAPTVPYEFIVLRLGLTADELQISEV